VFQFGPSPAHAKAGPHALISGLHLRTICLHLSTTCPAYDKAQDQSMQDIVVVGRKAPSAWVY
jgi:hypothetical protein